MTDLPAQLKQAFREWDVHGSGLIPVEKLQELLCKLNPSFSERDLDRLLKAVSQNADGLIEYSAFVDFLTSDTLASAAGAALPSGVDSDAKVSRLQDCLAKLRNPRPGLRTWMQDLRELLDPHQHPAGYRLCQNAAVSAGGVDMLLKLTQLRPSKDAVQLNKESDAIRSLAWELLARLCFGNSAAAEAAAQPAELLAAVRAALHVDLAPVLLCMLQLVQALAGSGAEACTSLVPQLLQEVVPLLSNAAFRTLQEAAFDVLVCCSRSHPTGVVDATGWSQLAALVDSGEKRPPWLAQAPLQVFLCGRLAIDVLTGAPEPSDPEALAARARLRQCVGEPRFLGFFGECLEAAVARREWPVGAEAYHNVSRLAELATKLCELGLAGSLVAAIAPLAAAVEASADDETSKTSLVALRALAADVACLQALLQMEAFRSETLGVLHRSGDEPEATELLSYLETVELAFQGAQAVLDESKTFVRYAPGVSALAELFARFAPLDKEMAAEQLLEAAPEIPLLTTPVKAALASHQVPEQLSFKAFADRIYGTPTTLGWWPSLMEDTAAYLAEVGPLPGLPALAELARVFESAAGGKSAVGAQTLLEQTLPAISLPVGHPVVEAALSELRGEQLEFKAFVCWLGELCSSLEERKREEEG